MPPALFRNTSLGNAYGRVTTVFVSGDSYASGSFSTRTLIVDLADGRVLGNLEEYSAARDGQPFKAVDFNYWGVTFVDSSRFYATLATGGHRYLVEGGGRAQLVTVRPPLLDASWLGTTITDEVGSSASRRSTR